ncbi:MAG: hypothetical protein ABIN35_00145 [candidate division WOR-3 bacterium]
MSKKNQKITYTRDEINHINSYQLKTIPLDDVYTTLRHFINTKVTSSGSVSTKQIIVPSYLKNKYGEIKPTITRGQYINQEKLINRRKLYTQKNETNADRINEEIRDLLTKISINNKDKMIQEFMSKTIPDECGENLIHLIHEFAVELSYLVPIYVEIIFKLGDKNKHLYEQLIQKITHTSKQKITSTDDQRSRIGNIILIGEIFRSPNSFIRSDDIIELYHFYLEQTSPTNQQYIILISELAKSTIQLLRSRCSDDTLKIIEQLKKLAYDQNYDRKNRFLLRNVIDLYQSDEQ